MTDDIEIDKELAKKTLRIYRDMNDGISIQKIMDNYNITSDEFKNKKLGSPASQRAAAKLANYPGSWSYLFHKYKLDKHGNLKERKITSPPAKKRKFNGVNFKRRNRSGMTKKQAEKYVKPLKDKFYYRIIEEDNKQWVYVRSKSASMKSQTHSQTHSQTPNGSKKDKKEKKGDEKEEKKGDEKEEKKGDEKEEKKSQTPMGSKKDEDEKKDDEKEDKKEVKVKIGKEDGDVVTIEGVKNRRIIIEPEIEDKEELEEIKKELEKEMGEKASFEVETDKKGKPHLYTDTEEPVETDVTIISRPQKPPEAQPQKGQEITEPTGTPTQPIPPGGFPQPDTGKMEGIPLDEKYKEGEEPTEGKVKPVEAAGVAPKKGKPGKSVEPMEVRTKPAKGRGMEPEKEPPAETPTLDVSKRLKEIEERERAIEREAERGELRKDIEQERQVLEEEKQQLRSAQGITETEQKYKQEIAELKQKIEELKSKTTHPRGEIRTLGAPSDVDEISPGPAEGKPTATTGIEPTTTSEEEPTATSEEEPTTTPEEDLSEPTPEMREEWRQRMGISDDDGESQIPMVAPDDTEDIEPGDEELEFEEEDLEPAEGDLVSTVSDEDVGDEEGVPLPTDMRAEWEDAIGDKDEEVTLEPTTSSDVTETDVIEEDIESESEPKRPQKVVAATPEEAEIETGEERRETEHMFEEKGFERTGSPEHNVPPDTDEIRVRCPVCHQEWMLAPDEIDNATCPFCGSIGVVREGVIHMKSPWFLGEAEPPEYTVPPESISGPTRQSQTPMGSKKDENEEEGPGPEEEIGKYAGNEEESQTQSQTPMGSKKDETEEERPEFLMEETGKYAGNEEESQTQSQAPMGSKKEENEEERPESEEETEKQSQAHSQTPNGLKREKTEEEKPESEEEIGKYAGNEEESQAQSQTPMGSKKEETEEEKPESEEEIGKYAEEETERQYEERPEFEEEDWTDEIDWSDKESGEEEPASKEKEIAEEWEMPEDEENNKEIRYRYRCSNCGEIVEKDDEYCENCGKKFVDVVDKEDYIDFEVVEEYMGGNEDNTAVKIREKIVVDDGGRELDVRVKKQIDKLWNMMDNYVENPDDKTNIIDAIKKRMNENEAKNPETQEYFEMGIVDGVDVAIEHIHQGIYGIISTADRDRQRDEARFNNDEFNSTAQEDDNVNMKQAADAYDDGFAEGYTSDEVKDARIEEIEQIDLPDTEDKKCIKFQQGELGITDNDDDDDKRWYITIKADGRRIANPDIFTKEDCRDCYGSEVDDYWYYELEWDPDKDADGGYNAQNGWDKPYCHQLDDKRPEYKKTYESPPSPPDMDPSFMHPDCRELHNQIHKLKSEIKMYTPKRHMKINRTMACKNIPYIANNDNVLKICGEGIRRFNIAQDNRYDEKVENTRDELEEMKRKKAELQRELNRCNNRYPPGQGFTDEDIEIEDLRDQAPPEIIDESEESETEIETEIEDEEETKEETAISEDNEEEW